MAKAKKQPDTKNTPETAAVAKKPPAKKAAPAASAATPSPMIDTNQLAQAAANVIKHRDQTGGSTSTSSKAESGSFKQMKEGIRKPSSHGPASFLQSTAPPKKSNLPFGGRKQVGHNQTFGADVNRTGVPRRTGG